MIRALALSVPEACASMWNRVRAAACRYMFCRPDSRAASIRPPVAGLPESEECFSDFRENRPRDGALESDVEPEGGFDAVLHDMAEQPFRVGVRKNVFQHPGKDFDRAVRIGGDHFLPEAAVEPGLQHFSDFVVDPGFEFPPGDPLQQVPEARRVAADLIETHPVPDKTELQGFPRGGERLKIYGPTGKRACTTAWRISALPAASPGS